MFYERLQMIWQITNLMMQSAILRSHLVLPLRCKYSSLPCVKLWGVCSNSRGPDTCADGRRLLDQGSRVVRSSALSRMAQHSLSFGDLTTFSYVLGALPSIAQHCRGP